MKAGGGGGGGGDLPQSLRHLKNSIFFFESMVEKWNLCRVSSLLSSCVCSRHSSRLSRQSSDSYTNAACGGENEADFPLCKKERSGHGRTRWKWRGQRSVRWVWTKAQINNCCCSSHLMMWRLKSITASLSVSHFVFPYWQNEGFVPLDNFQHLFSPHLLTVSFFLISTVDIKVWLQIP